MPRLSLEPEKGPWPKSFSAAAGMSGQPLSTTSPSEDLSTVLAKFHYNFYSRLNQRIIDTLIFGMSFYLAYQIRFAGQIPPGSEYQLWRLLVPVMLAELVATSVFGVHKLVWRYISLRDALRVARGHAAFSAIFLLVVPAVPAAFRIPHSIILIQFLLSLVAALGVRALRRIVYESSFEDKSHEETTTRVVLVGAGPAGVLVAKELAAARQIRPVGFLDDDPQIMGGLICGLRVLGSVDSLPDVVHQHGVNEVIISVAREQQGLLRRVWALCEALPVRIRIVPPFEEILRGKINISAFRDVDVEELMGRARAEVVLTEETAVCYRGKRVLITGAGGTIGSELARQLAILRPQELILLDKDENGLHDACLGIRTDGDAPPLHPVVADLRFLDRLRGLFARFRPEVIFHAAAHKHVPLMEADPCEAILNNVVSTRNLVEQAVAFSVLRFVLVSTDKAVRPASMMGASKRICEMIVQSQRDSGGCCFCCVRFGNVLGSRGSVLPMFWKQIARGEAVRITHADVRRYLMTIPEAVSLLIQAGALGSSGEIFLLDMGEPVLIRDLATRLIERCGLRPGRDIPVQITSLRPGEKLSEELYDHSRETLLPTRIPKINAIQSAPTEAASFARKLAALEAAARQDRPEEIHAILSELDIGFGAAETTRVAGEAQAPVGEAVGAWAGPHRKARAARQA